MQDLQKLYQTGYRSIPVICGPTASGKTSLAISAALQLGGEICCCDSMQIYMHLSIGTAKPTEEEKKRVPHHLIDLVEPNSSFHVAAYLEAAYSKIDELLNRGVLPVFCGGTGQYVQALQKGFDFDIAPVDQDKEASLRQEYERDGIEGIYRRLIELDPDCREKIHPNNTKRVIHTLALLESVSKTTKEIREDSVAQGPRYPFTLFAIDWPRHELYERINSRVDQMLESGILDEAEWLLSQQLPESCTAMQAIGYKELFPYLKGENSLEECVSLLKQHTRNYAKRQLTWFRHMDDVHWISGHQLNGYDFKSYLC
ncbi:MAG: tRNA (adenosine(37)-N6)-dimethylallyltransferase MiaA [Clostridiales bacterium]|nr:tRNA (adenosine(37)-N6)-dimethylallyltransferase MiaA [Clostridiales bacterium]